MPRQVKQFRVETKPLDSLLLEKYPGALAAKSLESALRIGETYT